MYCTILRLRGAVSFNQVPYPAGTVSSSSSCRHRPPWSRLLLALAPGSSQTSLRNLGALSLLDRKSVDDEWQPCWGEHPGPALFPPHSARVNSIWTPLSGRTLAWLKSSSISFWHYYQCDLVFFYFYDQIHSYPFAHVKKGELIWVSE